MVESNQGSVVLSDEEKAWLTNHPKIFWHLAPTSYRIEQIDEKGQYRGMAADYIALLEKILCIEFEIEHVPSWGQILKKTQNREVDMWGTATSLVIIKPKERVLV